MSSDAEQPVKRDRRGILGVGIAALAGTVVGSLRGTPQASAANGDPVLAGQSTTTSLKTELSTTGSIPGDAALAVTAPNADYGISASAANLGIYGKGAIGVYGEGIAGGVFTGSSVAISLTPQGVVGAPAGDSLMGDVSVDSQGTLWFCVAAGSPGIWVPISGGSTQFLSSPQRLLDTRNPGTGGRFAGGSTRTIGVTSAGIGVPDRARAIVANLTVTDTDDFGFLTAFPAGVARPITSNVNWAPTQTVANSATVKLGDAGQISLYVERSAADVIVDVAGYVI